MSWNLADRIELSRPSDPARDYCLWPYDPIEPVSENALRSSALLYHSFAVAGVSDRMIALCDVLHEQVGPFNTVWGVKHADGELSWEFYFYDYKRMERVFDTASFINSTRGLLNVTAPAGDDHPYFMFSVGIDDRNVVGAVPVDQLDLYIGNPGSAVSSGICYGLTQDGFNMRNFYFFFDAKEHFHDIRAKIVSNAHVPLKQLRIEDIMWPKMEAAKVVVVANKRFNDGLYFSRIPVDCLLYFMERLNFPEELRDYAVRNRDNLAHHLFDVGYDYLPDPNGGLRYLKGSYYGLL